MDFPPTCYGCGEKGWIVYLMGRGGIEFPTNKVFSVQNLAYKLGKPSDPINFRLSG